MFFIRGDDYSELTTYLEELHAVLKEALFDIANETLRDACVDELRNREQDIPPSYVKLKA